MQNCLFEIKQEIIKHGTISKGTLYQCDLILKFDRIEKTMELKHAEKNCLKFLFNYFPHIKTAQIIRNH